MSNIFSNFKLFYDEHPKFQIFLIFSIMFSAFYLVYTLVSAAPKTFSNFNMKDFKIKGAVQAPKKQEQPKEQVVQTASQSQVQAPAPDLSKENVKNINEIRKKRFDSDVQKKFSFENEF